jgi:hypothetical protein
MINAMQINLFILNAQALVRVVLYYIKICNNMRSVVGY